MSLSISTIAEEYAKSVKEIRAIIAPLDPSFGARARTIKPDLEAKIRATLGPAAAPSASEPQPTVAKPAPATPAAPAPQQQPAQDAPPAEILPETPAPEVIAPEPEKEKPQLTLSAAIAVKDFAEKLHIPMHQLLKHLMQNGIFATINEELDFETASIIAEDFGFQAVRDIATEAKIAKKISAKERIAGRDTKATTRPPVVTILGHVDHGKTSLLDAIRKTEVAAGEAGGITQHIGAYQITYNKRPITFIDTPGHEAFTEMRARGASVTDIAVIVVAADDGVKPQTIEAINHAKAANVPLIVAINKIDKPGSDQNKVKGELAEVGILTEGWGGTVPAVGVSAKTGEGLDDLLETILLVADITELTAHADAPAIGTVIESHRDKKGAGASILIQDGVLRMRDWITIGSIATRVRSMSNDRGEALTEATAAMPIALLGLPDVPRVGDILEVEPDGKTAKTKAETRNQTNEAERLRKRSTTFGLADIAQALQQGRMTRLNIVLKTDTQGSAEAIMHAIAKVKSNDAKVHILHQAIGAINESDVLLAKSANGIVVGFHTAATALARNHAEKEHVTIKQYKIIYELVDELEKTLAGMLSPEIVETVVGEVRVLKVFKTTKSEMIFGGKVTDGKVVKKTNPPTLVRIKGQTDAASQGTMEELQCEHEHVEEVAKGKEAGMRVRGITGVTEGSTVEIITREEKTRETLAH